MINLNKIDLLWDDNPVDITSEANFIWGVSDSISMNQSLGMRALFIL